MTTRCRTIRCHRSPGNVIRGFVARMMHEVSGMTTKRAMTVLTQNADRAPGCLWAAAVEAYEAGCRTVRDFEQWTGATLTQISK